MQHGADVGVDPCLSIFYHHRYYPYRYHGHYIIIIITITAGFTDTTIVIGDTVEERQRTSFLRWKGRNAHAAAFLRRFGSPW